MKLEFTVSQVKPPVGRLESTRRDSWPLTEVVPGRESFSLISGLHFILQHTFVWFLCYCLHLPRTSSQTVVTPCWLWERHSGHPLTSYFPTVQGSLESLLPEGSSSCNCWGKSLFPFMLKGPLAAARSLCTFPHRGETRAEPNTTR